MNFTGTLRRKSLFGCNEERSATIGLQDKVRASLAGLNAMKSRVQLPLQSSRCKSSNRFECDEERSATSPRAAGGAASALV